MGDAGKGENIIQILIKRYLSHLCTYYSESDILLKGK